MLTGKMAQNQRIDTFSTTEESERNNPRYQSIYFWKSPSSQKSNGAAFGLALTLAFFFLFLLCTTLATGRPLPPQTATAEQTMKVVKGRVGEEQVFMAREGSSWRKNSAMEERVLVGSKPPSCKSKCGGCVPCETVAVPLQPGMDKEYYPEVWRCKCGNDLYVP